MTTPTVTELSRSLEPVARDTFADSASASATPLPRRALDARGATLAAIARARRETARPIAA